MKFPNKKYKNVKNFFNDYFTNINLSLASVDFNNLEKIINILSKIYKKGKHKVFVCGNGGSAALSDHFACDHQKILSETGKIKPIIISLCSNSSLMTAISNDNSYFDIFSDQIKQIGSKGDVLIIISSSGKSQNVIKALRTAKKMSIKTVSFTGFSGGLSKKLANYNIHINSSNYGIIESMHHNVMNIISQYIKNKILGKNKIKKIFF